jgi:phosphohistidine swiveling domain-containing protein
MEKNKTIWRVYERDRIYPQNIPGYLDLMLSSKKGPYILKYFEVVCFSQDFFWWARDRIPIENKMRVWIKDWVENKRKFLKFCRVFESTYKKALKFRSLSGLDYSKLTNVQLHQVYRRGIKLSLQHFYCSEYPVDLFDDCFAKIFEDKLDEIGHIKISDQDKKQLQQPVYVSQATFYKQKILQLSFQQTVSNKVLNDLAKKYSWIQMSWDGLNELLDKHVLKEIVKYKKLKKNFRLLEIQRIKSFSKNIQSHRTRLIKKYQLSSKDVNSYFLLLDTFTKYHDWRKEIQLLSVQVTLRVLKEIAKRFKLSYRTLLMYFNWEIKSLLLNGKQVSRDTIKNRKKGLTFVVKKNKTQIIEGSRAKKVLDKLVIKSLKAQPVSKTSGLVANPGKIQGKAVVVKGAADALKLMKRSNILITSMTTVDYLPAMQKAGAIVTDDGGITCHAAIISRELGIPCIVGTKIATQIFKSGDLVEVDAERGIVRKL